MLDLGHTVGGRANIIQIKVVSGGVHDGDVSSILVDGLEQSPNERGLNVVVLDPETLAGCTAVPTLPHDSDTQRQLRPSSGRRFQRDLLSHALCVQMQVPV